MRGCRYLVGSPLGDCGQASSEAVSVRRRLSDRWELYPVCAAHRALLPDDLRSVPGFVVSAVYGIGDRAAREAAEAVDPITGDDDDDDPFEDRDPYAVPMPTAWQALT